MATSFLVSPSGTCPLNHPSGACPVSLPRTGCFPLASKMPVSPQPNKNFPCASSSSQAAYTGSLPLLAAVFGFSHPVPTPHCICSHPWDSCHLAEVLPVYRVIYRTLLFGCSVDISKPQMSKMDPSSSFQTDSSFSYIPVPVTSITIILMSKSES